MHSARQKYKGPTVEVINRMMKSDPTTDTDTDTLSSKQQAARQRSNKKLVVALESESEQTDEDGHHASAKIEWSENEKGGKNAYEQFKNRKSLKRKRAAAVQKRAKTGKSTTGVGKKSLPSKSADDSKSSVKRELRVYGDETEDDETLDAEIPDYLKARRSEFDAGKSKPQYEGLRLPPLYDDAWFANNGRPGNLQEKPQLPLMKPCTPYKDIRLRYSLGIIPAPMAQWLREYQVAGAEFLHELLVNQKGGILGDDMGLGKTIQVIACLTAAFGKTCDERDAKRMRRIRRLSDQWYPRVLLICPGSLMMNWQAELKRWGWWHADIFHGSTDEKESALNAAKAGRMEIMITTYDTYRLNKSTINTIEWDCVIADECHRIKTKDAAVTQAMNEVNALCRIGLTGTAIQNKYEDFWTLLNWTNPGAFGDLKSWKTHISSPLRTGQSHTATNSQLSLARKTAKKLVQNLLPQFFLRRTKALLADQLPKKSDRVVFCPLTPTQSDAYERFVGCEMVELIRTSTEECDCGSKKKRGWCCYTHLPGTNITWQQCVFPCINTLQKLCNHMALLIPSSLDPPLKQGKDLETLEIIAPEEWRDLYAKRDSILNFANQEFCGKWKILSKLLRFWHDNGDKVLIFSHSVRLLRMLRLLMSSGTTYNVSYLDGEMSYEDRQKAVDDFNADSGQFVFLISTKAGGVGLNIVSANKVVVFDPNWNPSWDQQAQDRAYRIGQVRDVDVFRLVSAGTIEEIVYARQIYKQQQANIGYNASNERRYFTGVQEDKDNKGEIFGLVNLFSYHGDNVVLRDIVNKTNVAESRAGIRVTGLDMGSSQKDGDEPVGDHDDAAMKELAALVEKGQTEAEADQAKEKRAQLARKDAVYAILASAGVQYSHENAQVIGTSKVEDRLSRKAQEAGDWPETRTDRVFGPASSQMDGDLDLDEPDDLQRFHARGHLPEQDQEKIAYRYRPPEDVRRRQFCSMADMFDTDVTEFAMRVENMTQAQRRDMLDKFYATLRKEISTNTA